MEFSLENLLSEPLYCIGSLRSRIKLLLALLMAYVFPRWAAKTVISKKTYEQFGLAGRWNTFTKGVRTAELCSNFGQLFAECIPSRNMWNKSTYYLLIISE